MEYTHPDIAVQANPTGLQKTGYALRKVFSSDAGLLFMKATLALGWPFSIEKYLGEMPTEADVRFHIESAFAGAAEG